MALIKAELKRGVLRTLFRKTSEQQPPDPVGDDTPVTTLSGVLNAFQDNGWEAVKDGRLVVSAAGGGRSVTYMLPTQWQQFNPEEIFALAEELQQVYADALVTLANNNVSNPTDQNIFDAMMGDDRLQTIKSLQHDYTLTLWPNRY